MTYVFYVSHTSEEKSLKVIKFIVFFRATRVDKGKILKDDTLI